MKKLAIFIFSVIIVCGTFSNSAFADLSLNGVVSPGIAEVQLLDSPVVLSVKGDHIGVDAVKIFIKRSQEISQLVAQNVTVTPSQKFSIEIGVMNLKCADYIVEVYDNEDNENNNLLESGTFKVIKTASQGTLSEIAERVETIDQNVEQELLPRTEAIQLSTEAIQWSTNAIQSDVQEMLPRTEAIQSSTNAIQSDVQEMLPRTEAIQLSTNAIQLSTNAIQSDVQELLPRTEVIQLSTNAIQSSTNAIQSDVQEILPRTATIESRTETIQESTDAIENTVVNELNPRTIGIESVVEDIQVRAGEIQNAVEVIEPIRSDVEEMAPRTENIESVVTSLETRVDSIARELGEERYYRCSPELSGIISDDVLVLDPDALGLSAGESVPSGELNVSANISNLSENSRIILLSKHVGGDEIPLGVISSSTLMTDETVVLIPKKVWMEDSTGIYARVETLSSMDQVDLMLELFFKVVEVE